MGRRLEELERPKAAERQASGINQYTEPSGNLPEGSKGDTRDKVAAAVGMSRLHLQNGQECQSRRSARLAIKDIQSFVASVATISSGKANVAAGGLMIAGFSVLWAVIYTVAAILIFMSLTVFTLATYWAAEVLRLLQANVR